MAEAEQQPEVHDEPLSISDILDSQLESHDGRSIGRVADIMGQWQEDGSFVFTYLVTGPQALLGRIARPLGRLAQLVLRDRFEYTIPVTDVESFGPTLYLKKTASEYQTGQSERWIARYLLRWLPGSGYRHE